MKVMTVRLNKIEFFIYKLFFWIGTLTIVMPLMAYIFSGNSWTLIEILTCSMLSTIFDIWFHGKDFKEVNDSSCT